MKMELYFFCPIMALKEQTTSSSIRVKRLRERTLTSRLIRRDFRDLLLGYSLLFLDYSFHFLGFFVLLYPFFMAPIQPILWTFLSGLGLIFFPFLGGYVFEFSGLFFPSAIFWTILSFNWAILSFFSLCYSFHLLANLSFFLG